MEDAEDEVLEPLGKSMVTLRLPVRVGALSSRKRTEFGFESVLSVAGWRCRVANAASAAQLKIQVQVQAGERR